MSHSHKQMHGNVIQVTEIWEHAAGEPFSLMQYMYVGMRLTNKFKKRKTHNKHWRKSLNSLQCERMNESCGQKYDRAIKLSRFDKYIFI